MIKNEDTYCTVRHKIVRELGAWEAVVYGTIANLLRKIGGYGNVSNQTLIDLIGKDKKSIYRWIDSLIKAGYLEKVGGKGRGNISIYYITKKGGKMTPFDEEKRGQNDTEKGANMTEKGGEMPPINKGENKEINKESGGVNTRDARDTTLSNTTPQIFENMEDFNLFWTLYPGDPEWSHEKENCERVWYSMQQNWRDNLIQQLQMGKRWRKREHDNPIWYLKNYSGEQLPLELPFMRQGTAAFSKWIDKAHADGKRVTLMRYPGEPDAPLAYCFEEDKDVMLNAGAIWLRDNV